MHFSTEKPVCVLGSSGRRYTLAVVNEAEAEIVRRIFDLYLQVRGAGAVHLGGPRAAIGRPPARYALTGLAKCAHCGGAILSARTRVYGEARNE
jgi:hypothetical protein